LFADMAARILPYRGNAKSALRASDPGRSREGACMKRYTEKHVPDFRGLSRYQALQILVKLQKKRPLTYNFAGKGRVVSQDPRPGSTWEQETVIQLQLGQE